ncbi:MAG TPA: ABC transporter ATP-binding protein [Candidatus Paceibacterota bacterium]|nr:ABC transporter ATP-binding protein [Candidatus Paceibacterota bacterium]
MAKPIVYIDHVEITYNLGQENEFKANKGTTLEVFDQEYIILFGPSGCGKSTLLYSIFGVLAPSAGKMYVNGESIYDYAPMDMVYFQRKTMGIMYQQFNLIPSITVLDNVALPLIFDGVGPREREIRAMELCKRFTVDKVVDKLPTHLSGGQQQRVSAARSLVNDPQILIADEPVGNLDSVTAAAVMATLDEINQRDKKTIFLVTHDAKLLPRAHRVVYLDDGRVLRVVPNPEKEQIVKLEAGSTIITEIEQVARIYPYDSPRELQAKSLINFLTEELSFDQILKLQKLTEQVIEGRLDYPQYMQILMRSEHDGGIGIPVARAGIMVDRLKLIIEHAHDVERYRRATSKDGSETYVRNTEYVNRIAEFLATQAALALDDKAKLMFEDIIKQRIGGFTRKEDFLAQIQMKVEDGGVGMHAKQAFDVTRLIEKLIALGIQRTAHH